MNKIISNALTWRIRAIVAATHPTPLCLGILSTHCPKIECDLHCSYIYITFWNNISDSLKHCLLVTISLILQAVVGFFILVTFPYDSLHSTRQIVSLLHSSIINTTRTVHKRQYIYYPTKKKPLYYLQIITNTCTSHYYLFFILLTFPYDSKIIYKAHCFVLILLNIINTIRKVHKNQYIYYILKSKH